jgi:hypothetical protein
MPADPPLRPSHELLEMLADPDVNLTVFVQHDQTGAGLLYSYEVCDPCEADGFCYESEGVLVSDFVYPSWFESFRTAGSTQFDKQGKVSEAFEILTGGYIGVYDVTSGHGWQQVSRPATPSLMRCAAVSEADASSATPYELIG